MFIRATRFQYAPDALDKRIAEYPQTMAPFEALDGYQGAVLFIDRSTNTGTSVTNWTTAEAMQASEATGATVRGQATSGGDLRLVDVARLEVVIVERAQSPRAGTFLRTNDFRVPVASLENVISLMRDRVSPVLAQQPGFRAHLVGVNRESGRIITSSSWETAEALESSGRAMQALRDELAQAIGAQEVKVEVWENVYTSARVAAPA